MNAALKCSSNVESLLDFIKVHDQSGIVDAILKNKALLDYCNEIIIVNPTRTTKISSRTFASMNDIINHVIAKSIRHRSDDSGNILASGYRQRSFCSEAELRYFRDIECYHINTLHSFFFNPIWKKLGTLFGTSRELFNLFVFCLFNSGCLFRRRVLYSSSLSADVS